MRRLMKLLCRVLWHKIAVHYDPNSDSAFWKCDHCGEQWDTEIECLKRGMK